MTYIFEQMDTCDAPSRNVGCFFCQKGIAIVVILCYIISVKEMCQMSRSKSEMVNKYGMEYENERTGWCSVAINKKRHVIFNAQGEAVAEVRMLSEVVYDVDHGRLY